MQEIIKFFMDYYIFEIILAVIIVFAFFAYRDIRNNYKKIENSLDEMKSKLRSDFMAEEKEVKT